MSKYLKAQSLNRQIKIQRNFSESPNEQGFPLEDDWRTVITPWAEPMLATGQSMIGQEFQAGGLDVSRIAGSFRIRKPIYTAIDAGMRIIYEDGSIYDIRAVIPDVRDNRFMFLAVANGANRG